MGRMRPGPGGGLFVGRPSINLPVASVVGYFRVVWEAEDGSAYRAILSARATIIAVAARLCCQRIDDKNGTTVQEKIVTSPKINPSDALITALADLSADPMLKLASRSLVTLSHFFGEPGGISLKDSRIDNREILCELTESIIAGDEQGSVFHAKRLLDFLEDRDDGRGKQLSDPFMSEGSPLNRSRVGQLVRTVATEINTGAFGEEKFLGSAAILADRYAAALGTVKQALAVLEDAGVVAVRRGRSNGWFACSPSLELPLRQVRNYLASCQVDFRQAPRLIEMIQKESGDGSKNAIIDMLIQALESYAALSMPT